MTEIFEVMVDMNTLKMTIDDEPCELALPKNSNADSEYWGQQIIEYTIDAGSNYVGVYSFSLQ